MANATIDNQRAQKGAPGILVAILFVYFIIPDFGYISAGILAISEACGVTPGLASYMVSIVPLITAISGVIFGFIGGRGKIKYKTIMLISITGEIIFGTVPLFLPPDFWLLLGSRAIFGFFLGFLMPCVNAFIAQYYRDKNQRARTMGWANAVFSVGAMFGLTVGGFLVGFAWNGSFALYGIGVIVLIVVAIFWKEDEGGYLTEEEKKEKVKLPPILWFYTIAFGVAQMAGQTLFSISSVIMIQHGLGDAGVAGLALTFFNLVGFIVALLFGRFFKSLKKWTLSFFSVFEFVGMFILFFGGLSGIFFIYMAGLLVFGIGHMGLTAGTPQISSLVVSPKTYAASLSIAAIFMNVGGFMASPFLNATMAITGSNDYLTIFLVAAFVDLALCVAYFLVARRTNLVSPSSSKTESVEHVNSNLISTNMASSSSSAEAANKN